MTAYLDPSPDPHDGHGLDLDHTADQVLAWLRLDQRRRWHAGNPIPVFDYLERFPQIRVQADYALDLIWSEYLLRESLGDPPDLEEYTRAFPQFASLLRRQYAVHRWVEQAESAPASTRTVPALSELAAPSGGTSPPGVEPEHAAREPSWPHEFELCGELGRGGMGIVYRAYDRRSDRWIALKRMRNPDPSALYRFKHEFRSLAGIAHPNLVTLHELISDGRDWFFTMDLVEGVDFLTHVRSPAPAPRTRADDGADSAPGVSALSPAQCDRLRGALHQMAEGVAALHEAGRLHRDLKPSNVLVTRAGHVVILDFGLSAELGPTGLHHSSDAHLLGTAAYMAPEQAAGGPVTPACDWYSVGVMLYEALTGRLPFLGRPLEVLADKQRLEPPPPRDLVGEVPADLDELCTALLRRDPESRPHGKDILSRLRRQPPPAAATGPQVRTGESLVGREPHLAALGDAYAVMQHSGTVLLLVHGRSGVGKTALIQAFRERLAADEQALVLSSRCFEQESVPYKALDGIMDALGDALRRLPAKDLAAVLPRDFPYLGQIFPTLRLVECGPSRRRRIEQVPDPRELRRRAVAALRDLLGRLGDRHPLVLVIDDLQWGDADSALLLADLLQPPDPPPLLLIGCYRRDDDAASAFLGRLWATVGTLGGPLERRELAVDELTMAQAETLAELLLGLDRDDPARQAHAAAVAQESEGNPFFITELVRHVRARLETTGVPSDGGSLQLDDVLWERIQSLAPAARLLLEILAVFGRPIQAIEACRAAGLHGDQSAVLGLLRAARLIRGTSPMGEPGLIETYHDRIRETVFTRIPAPELERHHLQLATTLAGTNHPDPETLAVHFLQSGRRREAAGYFIRAGDRAIGVLAFDRAATLYRMALELGPAGLEEGRRLRIKLGDALANAGRGGAAAEEYHRAAAAAESAESLELHRRAALQYLISGHVDEGLATLSDVLMTFGMSVPRTWWSALGSLLWWRARIRLRGLLGHRVRDSGTATARQQTRIDVCWSAAIGLSIIDPIRGALFQARGLFLALRAGDAQRLVRSLAMEAAHLACAGRPSRGRVRALLQAAEDVAQRIPEPYTAGILSLAQAMVATLQSRWQETRAFSEPAEAIFRGQCTGVAWERDTAQIFSLWSLMYLGELAELSRRWPGLMKEATDRGDIYAAGTLGTSLMTVVRLAADDPQAAAAELDQASGMWSRAGFHIQHHNRVLSQCYLALYCGDGPRVREQLRELWPTYVRSMLLRLQVIRIELLRLRASGALAAARVSADPGPFCREAAADARRLDREGIPGADAHARLIRAGLAALSGDRLRARTQFEAAIAGFTGQGMHIFAAAARRRLGELLGDDEGRALIAAADAWMSGQGVQNPDRMASLYAAGGSPRTGASTARAS
jgi:hypothetical protein